MTRGALLVAIAIGLTAHARHARASVTPAAKKEAKERFDRGLRLFDEGDKAGALAELERAYALVPSPVVLYDLALVHASMGHAVEAADALERVLKDPAGLSSKEIAHARKTFAEQSARVGTIVVTCDVEGAVVELDNLEVAKTPVAKPLRVTAGTHVVAVSATGRIPSRKAITVAGGAADTARFELAPLAVAPAQLAVHTRLLDVEVLANGVLLGTTPFAATVALAPGAYEIELRRRGHRTATITITLAAGGSGTVTAEPEEDPAAIGAIGGGLEVTASEPGATLVVDERGRGAAGGVTRLAPGLHRLRVERAGFYAFERDVLIETGAITRVRATLEPTSETRFAFERSARTQRTIGLALVGSGVLVSGLGAGFLVWNAGRKATADEEYERILFDSEPGAGRRCDPRSAAPASCRVELDAKYDAYRTVRGRDLYGWIGVGVGAAAATFGAIVLLRADSPSKYERATALLPSGWITMGGGGLTLTGAF
ncbi:MAG: PEGA domain-containing protein [Deltaproteobacteria bacterium]|nr:PEGA domain-containing protein [Deltaproteobacteria bacterium]